MSTLELFIRHSHYPYSAQKSSLITTRGLKRTPPPEESESLQPNAPRSDWGIILIRFHKHTSHWAHDEPPILFGYSVNQQHIHSNRLWVKGGAAQADRFRLIVLVYFFTAVPKVFNPCGDGAVLWTFTHHSSCSARVALCRPIGTYLGDEQDRESSTSLSIVYRSPLPIRLLSNNIEFVGSVDQEDKFHGW